MLYHTVINDIKFIYVKLIHLEPCKFFIIHGQFLQQIKAINERKHCCVEGKTQ